MCSNAVAGTQFTAAFNKAGTSYRLEASSMSTTVCTAATGVRHEARVLGEGAGCWVLGEGAGCWGRVLGALPARQKQQHAVMALLCGQGLAQRTC